MAKNEIEKLTELKARIDRLKAERAGLEGKIEHINSQLDEAFGTHSAKDLQKKLLGMKTEQAELEKVVADGIEKLEEALA